MYVSKSYLSIAYIVYFDFMMLQIPGTAICRLRIVFEWRFQHHDWKPWVAHWLGNVRELNNRVKRLAIMRPGETIVGRDMEDVLQGPRSCDPRGFIPLAEVEKLHIKKALELSGGVVGGPGGAVSLLGLPRQTLQYRIKKHGLDRLSNKS